MVALNVHESGPGQPAHDLAFPDQRLLDEAEALARLLARRGDLLPKDAAGAPDHALLRRLIEAVAAARAGTDAAATAQLYCVYAEMTAGTYPANELSGRGVLDTESCREGGTTWSRIWCLPNRPFLIGLGLFLLMLAAEAALRLLDGTAASWMSRLLVVLVIPALWGAIGTCTYLAKRLADKLQGYAFERARMQGDITRIFLGAMFGVLVVSLFYDAPRGTTGLADSFTPATAAFLAGLGIKPVYSAFEMLTEALSQRLAPKKPDADGRV